MARRHINPHSNMTPEINRIGERSTRLTDEKPKNSAGDLRFPKKQDHFMWELMREMDKFGGASGQAAPRSALQSQMLSRSTRISTAVPHTVYILSGEREYKQKNDGLIVDFDQRSSNKTSHCTSITQSGPSAVIEPPVKVRKEETRPSVDYSQHKPWKMIVQHFTDLKSEITGRTDSETDMTSNNQSAVSIGQELLVGFGESRSAPREWRFSTSVSKKNDEREPINIVRRSSFVRQASGPIVW